MTLSQWTKIGVAAASFLALTACNTTGSKSKMAGAAGGAATTASSSADAAAQTYGMAGSKGYRTDSQGFRVNSTQAPSNQTYYFSFNSSAMRPQDRKALMAQINYLASHPAAKIRLEGNTDNRGSREYNVGLGWRRDQTVKGFMEQQGVSPKQIQMVSYGKEHPAVQGDNERSWSLNRRVNFIYKAY